MTRPIAVASLISVLAGLAFAQTQAWPPRRRFPPDLVAGRVIDGLQRLLYVTDKSGIMLFVVVRADRWKRAVAMLTTDWLLAAFDGGTLPLWKRFRGRERAAVANGGPLPDPRRGAL